jgi:cell division protein FtsI/penicillin-binding protein 2
LRHTLAQAGYGQGQVLVSPLKMVRVAAAIAGHGRVPQVRWSAGRAGIQMPPAMKQVVGSM